ncbi:hypothetical protein AB1Y20_020554 [Prymnesium parvum]|uniref:Cell division control protein 24 OB domain-containing protein n=1 Tax=Prymnesium parvum TaxID=97485 RepID=A0AB34JVH5_PRYPA
MDAASFHTAVLRLQGLIRPQREYEWIADNLVKVLYQFPDGVTDSIVRCTLQYDRKRASGGAEELGIATLDTVIRRRQLPADCMLELRIRTIEADFFTLVHSDVARERSNAPTLVHCPDARLSSAVHASCSGLITPGRLLRLACGVTAEHSFASVDGGQDNHDNLLLLPMPFLTVVLQPSSFAHDRAALDDLLCKAHTSIRGQRGLPQQGALVLRVARIGAVEHYCGRQLRRVLLTKVDLESLRSHQSWASPLPALELSEVEAELLLWSEEGQMCRLLPEGSLACILQAVLISEGSAEVGGAPAQLGYGPTTLITIVETEAKLLSATDTQKSEMEEEGECK